MTESSSYYVKYPEDLDDRGWVDATSRGSLFGVRIVVGAQEKGIVVYDEFSLAESIRHEIGKYGYYCEGTVVVVQSVTYEHVEKAIRAMAGHGFRDFS
jgi:bacteriorhodopsin